MIRTVYNSFNAIWMISKQSGNDFIFLSSLKQGVMYKNEDKEVTEEKIVQFAQGAYDKANQRRVPEPITKL